MSGSNEIIRYVDKIPFSKREVSKAVENIIQDKLEIIEKELIHNNSEFAIKNTDLLCCFNTDSYIIFNGKTAPLGPDEFNRDYPHAYFPEESNVTFPTDSSQVNIISNHYEEIFPQRKNFYFVADREGKTVFIKNNGTWEKTDWIAAYKAFPVVILKLENVNTIKKLILYLLRNDLIPDLNFKEDLSSTFQLLSVFSNYVTVENNKFVLDIEDLSNLDLSNWKIEIYNNLLNQMGLSLPIEHKDVCNYLLNCEVNRCALPKYADSIITSSDQDAGLWNFWTDSKDDLEFGYPIPEGTPIVARNPKADVNSDGIIAIDFGTASTVVVRTNESFKPIQMCIGEGDKYENPTIMQVFSLENFMKAYKAKAGRPNTKWEDLWVSHAVNKAFNDGRITVDQVSSIIYRIKQWASEDKINTVIKPTKDDKPVTLNPLTELVKSDDFNPIEIYAYFIGLYINNRMKNHGIYLKYYMAFPAKFDRKTRENIRLSFEKGIRKSIPESIFEDPNNKLEVHMEVTEPEAYATCALQTFGFRPKTGDAVNYAIYDFGGGTSDFAYGHWYKMSGDDDRFAIKNISVDGNRFLGGENIIEGLAFEVFADPANLKIMDENDCCFNYGLPDQDTSMVPDKYLSDQQSAKKNMRVMIEKMREYWENGNKYFYEQLKDGPRDYTVEDIESIVEKLKEDASLLDIKDLDAELDNILEDLNAKKETPTNAYLRIYKLEKQYKDQLKEVDDNSDYIEIKECTMTAENIKEGADKLEEYSVTFTYSKQKIYDYFEEKIKSGVDSFFSRLINIFFEGKTFEGKEKERVNILLAGNSSKSPILRKVMREKIETIKDTIKAKYKVEPDFRVFSPLGSESVYDEMRALLREQGMTENNIERKINHEKSNPQKPTGKTGVAFGLVDLAKQSVKLERDESKEDDFRFYLGTEKNDDEIGIEVFVPIVFEGAKTKGQPNIGKWYPGLRVIPGRRSYVLRFTENPLCLGDEKLEADETSSKQITIPQTNEGEYIFIKAVNSKEILYAVAKNEDEAEKYIENLENLDSNSISF